MRSMKYRQDIQIMRGVAVLLVVLFHLNTPGLTNGFLGVDMFFVISGFLMALLYQHGKPLEFYRRRAIRLLPAYFFVVATTVLMSTWLTLPTEHAQVVEQGLFASVFSSNIGFWNQNSYFSKAEFNPLLHLWSLGVEIQFYLLVPALAWLHARFRFALPVLFVGSLLGCFVLVTISPKTAFFLMPFRIWQFLLGAAVAHYLTTNGSVRMPRPTLGLAALTAVIALVALFPVDGQLTDPIFGHPGGAAFLVTVATGVILACGLPQGFQSGITGSALQRLGNWSYSIYLVHFPIIVLCLYQPFSGTLLSPTNGAQVLLIVSLITLFTALSYGIFERRMGWIRYVGAWTTISSIAAIIVFSLLSALLNYWPYTERERNVLAAFSDRSVYRCGKLARILNPQSLACKITKDLSEKTPVFLLVGDSHSDAIKTTLAKVAYEHGYNLFFMTSNSPLVGAPSSEQVVALAEFLNASGIILHYASGNVDKAFKSGFTELAGRRGLPAVWLLPTPNFSNSVPKMIWKNIPTGVDFHPSPVNAKEVETLRAALKQAGVKTFDSYPAFCAAECDVMDSDMRPFYFDSNHLTLTGAERLRPVAEELMAWLILENQRHVQLNAQDHAVQQVTPADVSATRPRR